jgi:plasmid stabilization system protein ParE
MRVRLSGEAEREIDEIGRYIADDNPARAATFVAELIGQCEALAEHALRYPSPWMWRDYNSAGAAIAAISSSTRFGTRSRSRMYFMVRVTI